MFIFHLIAAIVITLWGVEESPVLIKELRDVFLDLVHGWDVDPRKARILRQIQEYVSLCLKITHLEILHEALITEETILWKTGWLLWRKRIRRFYCRSQTSSI